MDARALGRLDRLAGAVDVVEAGAGESADHRVPGALGDFVDRGEVAIGGDRKAGFDDVDAHRVEQFGDFEFFFMRHRRAGALLAVAQGGIEDEDAVLLRPRGRGVFRLGGWCLRFGRRRLGWRGHGSGSFWIAPGGLLRQGAKTSGKVLGLSGCRRPLSAQAQTPRRRSGGAKKQEPGIPDPRTANGVRAAPDEADPAFRVIARKTSRRVAIVSALFAALPGLRSRMNAALTLWRVQDL